MERGGKIKGMFGTYVIISLNLFSHRIGSRRKRECGTTWEAAGWTYDNK